METTQDLTQQNREKNPSDPLKDNPLTHSTPPPSQNPRLNPSEPKNALPSPLPQKSPLRQASAFTPRKLLWNSQEKEFHVMPPNPPFLPLKDIYEPQPSSEGQIPSLKEAEEVLNRPYRVLVTTLGAGVDYNHPGLSYKILRPQQIQPETSIKFLIQKVESEIHAKVKTLTAVKKKIQTLKKQKKEAQHQAATLIPRLQKKHELLIQEKEKIQKKTEERGKAQFRLSVSLSQIFTNYKDSKIKETGKQIEYLKSRPARIQKETDLLEQVKLPALQQELKKAMDQWIQILKEGAIAWDFEDQDTHPYMDTTKEEHLTGTLINLAISHNNNNISLLPLRILSPFKAGDLYKAVALAYAKGSRIVNISFQTKNEKSIKSLYRAMHDYPDMLFITSAGEGKDNIDFHPVYPASWEFPHLLVVGSEDPETGFSSNYGEQSVDIAVEPFSLLQSMNKKWTNNTKTSNNIIHETESLPSRDPLMAAAMVARLAAQIKYINPLLDPLQVIKILSESVVNTKNREEQCRFPGVLSEKKALNWAKKTLS